MNARILLTAMLVSTVTGYVDHWKLIHFSKSNEELRKCLENDTNLAQVLDETVEDAQLKSDIFERLSYLLHEQTVAVESIEVIALNSLGRSVLTLDEDQMTSVIEAIITALHACSDPKNPNSIRGHMYESPRFVQEIPEVAELLNMILVIRPRKYLHFPNLEFPELSEYSERSLSLIEAALVKMKNAHELNNELLRMWNRRAKLFYEHFYNQYIEYYFSSPNFTYKAGGSLDYYSDRRLVNFTARNPSYTGSRVFEMTSYHAMDWGNHTVSHVFSLPSSVSITHSQNFYELVRTGFFISLFGYLGAEERRLAGINYLWGGDLNLELRMLKSAPRARNGYGLYLETVQWRELTHGFANSSAIFSSLIQSLQPGDSINEFDLLMMFWHRLRSADSVITIDSYMEFEDHVSEVFETRPTKSRTTAVTTTSTTTTRTPTTDISFISGNGKSIRFKDLLSKIFKTEPPNSSTTSVTITSTMASSTVTSTTSSYEESIKGKGQITRLPSGKYKTIKRQRSGNEEKSQNSPKKCKYSQCTDDTAENYKRRIVDRDNSELPVLLENNMMHLTLLQDSFMAMLKC